MPANRASLAVTERYRAGMVAIRNRAKHEARQTWAKVKTADLDGTYEVGMLTLSVTTLQREAARLSSAYLSAFISSELGRYVSPPMVDARTVGTGFSGDKLRDALKAPIIGVKADIKAGKTPFQALADGRPRIIRQVGLATDNAARESLRTGMVASPYVIGQRRAVKGTCGACMGLAEEALSPPGTPLDVHPNCQCVSEAVIRPDAAKATLNKASLVQLSPGLVEKSIYQWTTDEQLQAYGFTMTDYGDAVPAGYNYSFFAKNAADEVVGRLDINTAGSDGVIGIVEVQPGFRRMGIATKMLDYFHRYEPDMSLDWGMTTEDGTALRASMPKEWQ